MSDVLAADEEHRTGHAVGACGFDANMGLGGARSQLWRGRNMASLVERLEKHAPSYPVRQLGGLGVSPGLPLSRVTR